MRGVYNSLGYIKEYYPGRIYFVHDSRRDGPDNNPLRSPNHFLVYYGDPYEDNREWHPTRLGLTLQEAKEITNNRFESENLIIRSSMSYLQVIILNYKVN